MIAPDWNIWERRAYAAGWRPTEPRPGMTVWVHAAHPELRYADARDIPRANA